MIDVQLLGATEVRTADALLTGRDFGGAKPRQLLELLSLNVGVPLSKDRLADLLWDGCPPVSFLTTLEGYVSLLRRRIEPGVPAGRSAIRTVQGGYLLDGGAVRVDCRQVQDLVGQARVARAGVALSELRRALELGDGELLSSSASTAWAATARHAHLRLLVDAATTAAEHAVQLGRLDLAVTLADRALALDPMAEQACRCVMTALWSLGRTAEALRHHAELRTVLAEELGVDPDPATQALMGRLLRDEAPPVVSFCRRSTDGAPAADPDTARQVDLLASELVAALRRSTPAVGQEHDDPRLVSLLRRVVRHLQAMDGEPLPQRDGLPAQVLRTSRSVDLVQPA